jgi:NAD(P)-dependent dehydrogenase (short-subunit alcohol dehydrogenase family)
MVDSFLLFCQGAGSGIGQAICRCFAQEGAIVVGGDVNTKAVDETLKKLAAGKEKKVLGGYFAGCIESRLISVVFEGTNSTDVMHV